MSRNDDAIIKRLNELYKVEEQSIKKLPLNINDKYALFSDLHLGDGGKVDNFVHNEKTMGFALKYYKNNGYSIILLGDVEELWQFNFTKIRNTYDKSIYEYLRKFPDNKVHRIFGNHDMEWAKLPAPVVNNENIPYGTPEAIMLDNYIFLVHGHQGDNLCDRKASHSRFWARLFKIFVPIAKIFGYENYSATQSQIPKDRERLYYNWANGKNIILICGHTHRAIFASRSYYEWLKEQIELKKSEKNGSSTDKEKLIELSKDIKKLKTKLRKEKRRGRDINPLVTKGKPLPCYFNTGCGLYRKGITNIEIERDKIRLIKWHSDNSLSLEKRRIEFWEDDSLSDFKEELNIKTV